MTDRDGPWTVILADDDDDHAVLIERALERAAPMALDVRRARNGDEAIELVEADPPDLLLLDLNMPGRSGHEVLERIKGDHRLRSVPVAVLTSSDRDEDMARSYGLGGNHFITKPGDPAELEARLRTLLKNLGELGGIRRGTEGVRPSGMSAINPGSMALRRALPWIAFGVVVVALRVFALVSGAF